MKHTNYTREKDRTTAQPTRLTAAAKLIQRRSDFVPSEDEVASKVRPSFETRQKTMMMPATPALHLVPVCIEFTHPTATTVCLAGTFNNWKPESKILHSPSTGRWWKDMALAPGTYEYCLVVDGQWMPDPLVKETVPNPFGGSNSVLRIASSPEAAHLANAESLPFIKAGDRKI